MTINENDDLDLSEKTFLVKIGGVQYIIVEADSKTATRFRNIVMSKVTMNKGRMENLAGMADGEPFLVAGCLFLLPGATKEMTPEELVKLPRVAVTVDSVKAWPNRVIRPLYDKAREISGLEEKDEDDAKNSPSGTPTGSA